MLTIGLWLFFIGLVAMSLESIGVALVFCGLALVMFRFA
jgi:hypothetical protein